MVYVRWNTVLIGVVIAIILGFLLRLVSPSGAFIGFLIATIYVGYMIGGDYLNGAVNGALVGIVAAIVLFILALIGFGVASGLPDIIILTVIGAIGGVIGVLIRGRGRF
jgi:hypothetical protein